MNRKNHTALANLIYRPVDAVPDHCNGGITLGHAGVLLAMTALFYGLTSRWLAQRH